MIHITSNHLPRIRIRNQSKTNSTRPITTGRSQGSSCLVRGPRLTCRITACQSTTYKRNSRCRLQTLGATDRRSDSRGPTAHLRGQYQTRVADKGQAGCSKRLISLIKIQALINFWACITIPPHHLKISSAAPPQNRGASRGGRAAGWAITYTERAVAVALGLS